MGVVDVVEEDAEDAEDEDEVVEDVLCGCSGQIVCAVHRLCHILK